MQRALTHVVAGAVLAWLLAGLGFVNYDTLFNLNWGHELAEGRTPELTVERAPTPKPLVIAAGAVLAPLEHTAQPVVAIGALVALGALAAAAFAVAHAVSGSVAGVVAAVLVLTREPVLSFGVRAYIDIPYAALVLAAVALALRRPSAFTPIMLILGLAGLLRPEAWLLGFAYAAYVLAARRPDAITVVRLAGLAVLAPAAWLLADAVLAGDPLWSLTGTQEAARVLERPRGLGDAALLAPRRLGEIVREPVLFAALGGAALCIGPLRARARPLLGATLVAGLAFAALAAGGLPVLGRYLLLAGALVVVLAAVGVVEGVRRARGASWPLRAFAVVAVLMFAAFTPAQVERIERLQSTIAAQRQIVDDLHAAVHADRRSLGWCPEVTVASHRLTPLLAAWLDQPASKFRVRSQPGQGGVYVAPATSRVARLFVLDRGESATPPSRAPREAAPRYANRSWRLLASPPFCRA
ncbi:hypothetical protein [Thermoleophilum album]|uniref:Dolichyl-phosphate-mannose-protein mannosyltransferase n=1 Tax=Thermoleophilum album TaxID=29539 RepID=A0A1H6FHY1_THEAL|nr:hypothetical protein [Thermoleophilum album]SEH10446.1 hypothetical protein SAMN02745716_0298 [Thermoleophilum album]